jgi:hypothetical protein
LRAALNSPTFFSLGPGRHAKLYNPADVLFLGDGRTLITDY